MSLLIFLGVLSTLVIVHEWGHYITAKKLGIGVHRFSIGFGPVLFRRQGKETEFCVSLIPLGGYVKLEGEESKEAKGGPAEFSSRPAWQRFLVVFAGPSLNAILAFVIFSGIFMAGNPTYSTVVGKVLDGYPSQQAGIREGDRLVRMSGTEVKMWEDLLAFLATNGPKPIDAEVLRGGQTQHIMITPRVEEIHSLFGKRYSPARIGIMPSGEVVYVRSGPLQSIGLGASKVAELTGLIFKSLAMLVTGQASFKDSMTGPIGIYFMTEQAAKVGIIYLMYFTASLSVSLFVLNLLPIPVLDGGHLFYIIVEALIRRKVSDKIKDGSVQIGMYLLLGVAGLVIWQDLVKYGLFDKLKHIIGH